MVAVAETNVELARHGFEAALRGDLDAIREFLDPDVQWHGGDPSAPGACHNREQALEFMRQARSRRRVGELAEVVDAGDKVVVIMRPSWHLNAATPRWDTATRPTGVRRLATRMGELGIEPELEVYDTGHLDAALMLRQEGLLFDPLQFSIVLGVRGGAAATPENLISMVRRLPADAVWQVIGIGRDNLSMTTIGLAMGGNARTGMEDTLMLRRGEPTPGNRPLVERLAQVARSMERPPASVEVAREKLGLPVRMGA
jgi:uncharacterized protein (DUF849 family)